MTRTLRLTFSMLATAFVLCAAWPFSVAHAGAGAIEVTTTDDELNADGDCSLREAVMAVNTGGAVDACPGGSGFNEIFLEPVEYVLTIAGAGEDAGLTGDLDILSAITISRNPAAMGRVTVDGGGLDRIFDIHPSALGIAIVGVDLRSGDAGSGDGGAVRVSDVTCDGSPGSYRSVGLWSVVLEGNRASQGGALHVGECNLVEVGYSSIVSNAATDVGGGVSIIGDSVMSIDTSTISANEATSAGGGVWSDMPEANWGVRYSTVADNSAADGGGIWSRADRFAAVSVVAQNQGGNCGGPGAAPGSVVSDDTTCGSDSVRDAGLLPLTTIGGMPVHPLAANSPAIEAAGVPVTPWCNDIGPGDQVGNPRPVDGDGDGVAMCDAGAIEAVAVSPPPASSPLPDTSVAGTTSETRVPILTLVISLPAGLLGTLVIRKRLSGRRSP